MIVIKTSKVNILGHAFIQKKLSPKLSAKQVVQSVQFGLINFQHGVTNYSFGSKLKYHKKAKLPLIFEVVKQHAF